MQGGLLAGLLRVAEQLEERTGLSGWPAAAVYTVLVPLLTLLGWQVLVYFRSPLRQFPGPFLAGVSRHFMHVGPKQNRKLITETGWTNLWRLFIVRTGNYHHHIKKLHDKHGPVVRIGPNLLDLDYPELIKTVYGTDESWLKVRLVHEKTIGTPLS